MNPLAQALVAIAADLRELRVQWALVGGLAVSVWAEPRLTRDIDLAVAAESDRDSERLVRDLSGIGYRTTDIIEHEPTARSVASAAAAICCLHSNKFSRQPPGSRSPDASVWRRPPRPSRAWETRRLSDRDEEWGT